MIRASVFIATSLDGFIARDDGALDWLPTPEPGGDDFGYARFMATIDVIVMGRHTFSDSAPGLTGKHASSSSAAG
jgi:dihydrofolate reductase